MPIGGIPLLHKLVAQLRAAGVRRVVVVRGYAADKVQAGMSSLSRMRVEGTGELLSLGKAMHHLRGEAIISFGDIIFANTSQ